MAFSEFEIRRFKKIFNDFFKNNEKPDYVRKDALLSFKVYENSVEILECFEAMNTPDKKIEEPIAKASFDQDRKLWKIYWKKDGTKWQQYEDNPEVKTLEEFLTTVKYDENLCFFG